MLGSAWLVPTFFGGGSFLLSPAPPGLCRGLSSGDAPGLWCPLGRRERGRWRFVPRACGEVSQTALGAGDRGTRGGVSASGVPLCGQTPACACPRGWAEHGAHGQRYRRAAAACARASGFTRVPSHACARAFGVRCGHTRHTCTRDTRARGSPRALPRVLVPARCSEMCVGRARAAQGRTLGQAMGWLVPLRGLVAVSPFPGDQGMMWPCCGMVGTMGLGAFEDVGDEEPKPRLGAATFDLLGSGGKETLKTPKK